MHEVVAELQVKFPGAEATVYAEIASPFEGGALHDTVTEVGEAIEALTFVGVPGGAAGTTTFDCTDAFPVPEEFVAVTVNV